MSSVQYLREFINERLKAAAEEIFLKLETTIVQYEVEIDRQRRLLDENCKPEIKINITDLPQPHICKDEEEEGVSVQQFCTQGSNSCLHLKEPEPVQLQEQREDLLTGQGRELLDVKKETDTYLVTPVYEESNQSESGPNSGQLPSHCSPISDSEDEEQSQHFHSKSTRNTELNTGERSFSCKICSKDFSQKSTLTVHMRTHADERPYTCKLCGKCFRDSNKLLVHMRTHTGERPYSCKVCWKSFSQNSHLTVHMKTHKGMKSHTCQTCGKFFSSHDMLRHATTHTGEIFVENQM